MGQLLSVIVEAEPLASTFQISAESDLPVLQRSKSFPQCHNPF